MQGDVGLLLLKIFSCVFSKPEVVVPAPRCLRISIESAHENEEHPKRSFGAPLSFFILVIQ